MVQPSSSCRPVELWYALAEVITMAMSTCIKCGNHRFEVVQVEPNGASFKYHFVQCTSCGGVVGVLDFYNIGETLNILARKLGISLDL
jgi:hypothetical protein